MMRGTSAGSSVGGPRALALGAALLAAACNGEKPPRSWTGDLIIRIAGNGTVRSTLSTEAGLQRLECRGKGGTMSGGCDLQTSKADKGLPRPELLVEPGAGFEFRGWSSGDTACTGDGGANLLAVRIPVQWAGYQEDLQAGTASYRNECLATFQALAKPRAPVISGTTPPAGPAGTEIVVAGQNLGGARSAVEFEGVYSHVIAGAETELRTVVPVDAKTTAVTLILWTPTGKAVAPKKFLVGGTPGDGPAAGEARVDLGTRDGPRPADKAQAKDQQPAGKDQQPAGLDDAAQPRH